MMANQGSTTMRNMPDVALTAENVYVRANGINYTVGGTSCAAPLWAGFAALVNQQAVSSGEASIGFINPGIYAIGLGTIYASAFHDITTGNNTRPGSPTRFYAVTGYDLCTGWGTPAGQNLIDALVGPPVPTPPTITSQPQSQTNVSGSSVVFGITAVGSFPLSYQWKFGGTNIAGGTNAALTFANVQPTNAGVYSVAVTNLYGLGGQFECDADGADLAPDHYHTAEQSSSVCGLCGKFQCYGHRFVALELPLEFWRNEHCRGNECFLGPDKCSIEPGGRLCRDDNQSLRFHPQFECDIDGESAAPLCASTFGIGKLVAGGGQRQ